MKRFILTLTFLLICGVAFGAPTNSMSITPAATDATVIEAPDENARNNEISTKFNAHSHSDISQVGNTLKVGNETTGNKTIQANNADTNKPYLRYDDSNDRWEASIDGTTVTTLMVMSGTTVTGFYMPESPTKGDVLFYNGHTWGGLAVGSADTVLSSNGQNVEFIERTNFTVGSLAKDTTDATGSQSITGIGFKPKLVIAMSIQDTSDEIGFGYDDGSTSQGIALNDSGAWSGDTNSFKLIQAAAAPDQYSGSIATMDVDGFTINWTKTNNPSGTLTARFIAIR